MDELLKKGLVVSRTAAFDKRNDLRFDLIKIKFMVDFMTLKAGSTLSCVRYFFSRWRALVLFQAMWPWNNYCCC